MARIRRFEKGGQDVRPHVSEVDCYFQVLVDADGRKLLHLSTFGSDQRQSKPKSSQVLQLDESAASELIEIVRSAFPQLS